MRYEAIGLSAPVLAAPMAGGATTRALLAAAAAADSLGFLPGGYLDPDAFSARLAAARTVGRFGVNLFVPNPSPVDPSAYRAYARQLAPEARALGAAPPIDPVEDDDWWSEKLALLRDDPVSHVGFTFGIPPTPVIRELRRNGTVVLQTVTTVAEARRAAHAGVDVLVVQGAAAGGHSGTLDPRGHPRPVPLTDLIRGVATAVELPVLAAGGLSDARAVGAVLTAGAIGALVGTALLRTPESGASPTHKHALATSTAGTLLTRAFTGRVARGIRNGFLDRHDATAPYGYPAIHHLTSTIRRAAAAAGDADRLHLWAGTGYRSATDRPAAEVLTSLLP